MGDLAVGSALYRATRLKGMDYAPWPVLDAYIKRLAQRPAFLSTIGVASPPK